MDLPSLIGSALLTVTSPATASPGPPERIVLPVIQPGCDRADEPEVITVCGRKDRRFRIDPATLSTLRTAEARDSNEARPRPRAFTGGCSEPGPFGCRGEGVIPVSMIVLKAATLAIKAIRGEDLRPLLRQGPTDDELYKEAKADADKGE